MKKARVTGLQLLCEAILGQLLLLKPTAVLSKLLLGVLALLLDALLRSHGAAERSGWRSAHGW